MLVDALGEGFHPYWPYWKRKRELGTMMKFRLIDSVVILIMLFVTGCVPVAAPSPVAISSLTPPSVTPTATLPTGTLLPVRGLYVQFERRGWASEYWPGQVIQLFNMTDEVVGQTVREEVALQLDQMKEMGVNTIAYELRSASPPSAPDIFVPPTCTLPPVLGLQYPKPTDLELANLVEFFDLLQSKGMKIHLRLVNTHMEEQPPENNTLWIGAILNAIKDHPAFDLVLFEGAPFTIDTNGDGVGDRCGGPAEAPLWNGPGSVPANYVQWAIQYGHSLGVPYRKLSAEAIVGDYYSFNQGPGGPEMTDNHQWDPVFTLKSILDNLNVPDADRTYALSWYEHPKCLTARQLPCVDADAHAWAIETATHIFDTIGRNNGARVVVPEMGLMSASDPNWTTEMALESLVWVMHEFGIDGGCFWRWTDFDNNEENDPSLATPIKKRGKGFVYTPVADVLKQLYTQGEVVDSKFDPAASATAMILTPEFQDSVSPNDTFDGTSLNQIKWRPIVSEGATLRQDGRLILSTDGSQPTAGASVASNWVFPGDFDVQVGFQLDEDWTTPAHDHVDGAYLSVDIDGQNYRITRLGLPGPVGQFMAWSTTGALTKSIDTDALTGKYRITRAGATLTVFFDVGKGWQELDNTSVPASPAQVVMGNSSVNASLAFTTYFDNFQINSGLTTYRP
jgi:hypothetical protein